MVVLSYGGDSSLLFSKLRDGVAGDISTKVDTLELDLFEQSVQMRRCESLTE